MFYWAQARLIVTWFQSLAFSPRANLLASGGYRTVKLWRRPDGVRKMDLWGAGDPVRSLAVSPDDSWAAAGDTGGEITLWGASFRPLGAHD